MKSLTVPTALSRAVFVALTCAALAFACGGSDSDPATSASSETDPSGTSGGVDPTGTEDLCGNGVLDPGESCDGADLGGVTCGSLGFDGGTLACTAECAFDTSGCVRETTGPSCGNGVIEGDEACDGADLGGETCEGLGFDGGTLSCASDCTFDTAGCDAAPSCGNGVIEGDEECDGAELGGETCEGLGFDGGTLSCASDCTFDTDACTREPFCGDGVVNEDLGEECDDGEANSDRLPNACRTDCTLPRCGDGVIDDGEQCDDGDANGPDAPCSEACTINPQAACAGNGAVTDLLEVAAEQEDGSLLVVGELASIVGDSFATAACGPAAATRRQLFFVTAPEAGLWEFSLVDERTTAAAALIAIEGCDADALRLACTDADTTGRLLIEAGEGQAFFLALEAEGTARAFGLQARLLEGLAGEGEACGASVACEDGLLCAGADGEERCIDPDSATLESVEVLLPTPDLFVIEMRGQDPGRLLDLVHIEQLLLAGDLGQAGDLTFPPDVLLRDGDGYLMRLFLPVDVFDEPEDGFVIGIEGFESITVAAESGRTGQRTASRTAPFPSEDDLLVPEEAESGGPCDLEGYLFVCPEGEACGEVDGAFLCGEPAAPVLDRVTAVRTALNAVRITIDGRDENADVVELSLSLYRPGEEEPAFTYAPLALGDALRGQRSFTWSITADEARFNGLLNATDPAFGFDRIAVMLTDATGLTSETVFVDYPAVEVLEPGASCDLQRVRNVCPEPQVCGRISATEARCGAPVAPEVRGVTYTIDDDGITRVSVEGFHANANVTGFDLFFRVADPASPEEEFIGLAERPATDMTPNPAGRTSFVAALPALNLGDFELTSILVRLRSGALQSPFFEVPFSPVPAGGECDPALEFNPCAAGSTCAAGTCEPAAPPVLVAAALERPAADRIRFRVEGEDPNGDVAFLELAIQRANGTTFGQFSETFDDPGVDGLTAFEGTVTIEGFQNEPTTTAFVVRLRDRAGLHSEHAVVNLPPIIPVGGTCEDGTGVTDVCALGALCEEGVCVPDVTQDACAGDNLIDFATAASGGNGETPSVVVPAEGRLNLDPFPCAAPVSRGRVVRFVAPVTGDLQADATRISGNADPVLAVSRDACDAEPFACHDDVAFPDNLDSRLVFPVNAGDVLYFRVGDWESGGDIRLAIAVEEDTCGNGIIDDGEDCDGDDLGDATCATVGFDEGTLACTATCTFDTSGCTRDGFCGDGVVDPGEQCDDGEANGPDAPCSETCTLDPVADCAGQGDVLDFVAVAELQEDGSLLHTGTLAPLAGEAFSTAACGGESTSLRALYFIEAPVDGTWEFSLVDERTSASAALIALDRCHADARQIACDDGGNASRVLIDALEGDALYLALESDDIGQAYALRGRLIDGTAAGLGEACDEDTPCDTGLACSPRPESSVCASSAGISLESLTIRAPDSETFLIDARGTDPAHLVDQLFVSQLAVAIGTASNFVLEPDAIHRDGDQFTLRVVLPVSIFDTDAISLGIDDFNTLTAAVEATALGWRSPSRTAAFPAASAVADPQPVEEGEGCDLDRLLFLCPDGQACDGEEAPFACADAQAPTLLDATATRLSGTSIRFDLRGTDPNGDITTIVLAAYRPGSTEPDLTLDPIDVENAMRGQREIHYTFRGDGGFFSAQLNATAPEFGFDRIGLLLVDATGLASDVVVIPYPSADPRATGEPCDLTGASTWCEAPGTACTALPSGDATCAAFPAPEVRALRATLTEGVASIRIEGAHAAASVEGVEVIFRLANPPNPETPFIGLDEFPATELAPAPAGRTHFTSDLPPINLGGNEVVTAAVRLRAGNLRSLYLEVPFNPLAAGATCDASLGYNPCDNGLTCTAGTCSAANAPTLTTATITRPRADAFDIAVAGLDPDGDIDGLEYILRREVGTVFGSFFEPFDPPVDGQQEIDATVRIEAAFLASEPASTTLEVRLRDRSGRVSNAIVLAPPPVIPVGGTCVEGTGLVDLCTGDATCIEDVCVLPDGAGLCDPDNIIDFNDTATPDEDTGTLGVLIAPDAYFPSTPFSCAAPVNTARAIRFVPDTTTTWTITASAVDGTADPVLSAAALTCDAEPFVCNDDIDFPDILDSELRIESTADEPIWLFVGNWETTGTIRLSIQADD
ncbi:MAG: hypothetical protein EA398_11850 [Deltaproteobacteria bacterium]|nr:MAG: hypothetical protein EA398_11850 [Deltaproteobacteria bacterium]